MTESLFSAKPSQEINKIGDYFSGEFLDKIPVAVYSCDASGNLTAFNQASVALWGRTPEIGKEKWSGAFKIFNHNGLVLSPERSPMAKALKEKRALIEEIIIEKANGIKCHVLSHPSPLFSSTGEIIGAVDTLIDLTEKNASEEKHAMLAAIIESSDDAIISKTLEGKITSWNAAAEYMFGYKEHEVLGKHISILIPKSRLQEEDTIITNIKNGTKVDHFETIRITKSGREIAISLTVSPIKNSRGVIIGASKIARDISVQVAAQEQLQLYNSELEKMNSYKDEFIGMASHELKTPLTSVSLYLQMLARSLSDEANKKFVIRSVNQINKLSGLISDLLDVSKVQSGKLILRPDHFDLVELIDDVVEILQETNRTHTIVFEKELAGAGTIYADKHRVEQVLINLLNNAIKYSPKADRVIVKLSTTADRVRVEVKDFGIGVPIEQQQRIFDRFYRIEELGPAYSGLGIGLYLSSEIVSRHGGKLWVESALGAGSTFIFEFPFALTIQ